MPWRNIWLCFVLLTSCCDGRTDEEERSAVKGSHLLSHLGLKLEPSAPARPGSLTFRHDDQQGDLNSTKVSQNGLAAKIKLLNPSVQCGDNQMTLTISRVKSPHFLVDGGKEPHTPLAQMPTSCGFSVKRSRRHVQYATSYQGCHVNKEDGDYLLPLLFQGTPMAMSCPNTLTSPAVACFPSKMVVKLGGVAAKDLKIKVSGTWQPLSSTCSSCGLTFKEVSGNMALIAPYNTDVCVEFKNEEFSLSLQWGDYELLAVCPAVPDINPTTEATPPSSDSGQVLQQPHNSYFQMFSQMLQPWPTSSPDPGALPFFFVATHSPENQKVPEVQSPASSFVPQVPQFFVFPRPESPQTSGIESSPIKQVQFPQMPQSLQYQVPIFSEFPMVPGIVQQATQSPLPSSTETLPKSEPAAATEEKFQLSLQSQFPVLPQRPFPSFFKLPFFSEDKTPVVDYPETDIEQPQHPQVFQFPMMYSPLNYPSNGQSMLTFTAAPATTSTSAASAKTPQPENAFYPPDPYMPFFLLPEQASVPVFLHPPNKLSTNSAPSGQHEHQPVYHVLQPFYPFLPDQRQTELAGS